MISKESAEYYKWGEQCEGWHLVKSKSLSVIQECIPAGAGEIKHMHLHAEQFFFVLFGVAKLTVEDETYVLSSHQGCHVPAGKMHFIQNKQKEDLVFTVTSTPPTIGDRVER